MVGQGAYDGQRGFGPQIGGNYCVAARQQIRDAAPTDLAEGAGDQDGDCHDFRFLTSFAPTRRTRSVMRTENSGLKMSSRNRVSLELLMYQRPSVFT